VLLIDGIRTLVNVVIANPWGGHDGSNSSKGRILSQSTFNKHVFPDCHRGFWVPTLTNG
jgi:hypothetical protein